MQLRPPSWALKTEPKLRPSASQLSTPPPSTYNLTIAHHHDHAPCTITLALQAEAKRGRKHEGYDIPDDAELEDEERAEAARLETLLASLSNSQQQMRGSGGYNGATPGGTISGLPPLSTPVSGLPPLSYGGGLTPGSPDQVCMCVCVSSVCLSVCLSTP